MNKYTIDQLRDVLAEYDIDEKDIVGTGKNGRVIKSDIYEYINNYLIKEDIYDDRQSPSYKPKKKVSPTAGLKKGDIVLYDDGIVRFEAVVENVTATTKAQIRALKYVNDMFNPDTVVNTYRKNMTIIKHQNPNNKINNSDMISIMNEMYKYRESQNEHHDKHHHNKNNDNSDLIDSINNMSKHHHDKIKKHEKSITVEIKLAGDDDEKRKFKITFEDIEDPDKIFDLLKLSVEDVVGKQGFVDK
jgi:hypothetical protein